MSVHMFVVAALKSGLTLYHETGMKPNREWTPKNMMATAEKLTGKTFKKRDYPAAIAALEAMLKGEAPRAPTSS